MVEYKYSERELKERMRLVKYFRGTHERFKKIKGENFETKAKDFIDNFFAGLEFDEDETIIALMNKSYSEVRDLLLPHTNKPNVDRFLKTIKALYTCEFYKVVSRYYR